MGGFGNYGARDKLLGKTLGGFRGKAPKTPLGGKNPKGENFH